MQNNRVMLLLGALLTFACIFFMTYHFAVSWKETIVIADDGLHRWHIYIAIPNLNQ